MEAAQNGHLAIVKYLAVERKADVYCVDQVLLCVGVYICVMYVCRCICMCWCVCTCGGVVLLYKCNVMVKSFANLLHAVGIYRSR